MTELFAVLIRGAHYASVISSFGCFAFLLAVARPAWRAAGARAEKARRLEHFLLPLAVWSVTLAVASGLLWLWLVTASMAELPLGAALSPQLIGTVLSDTGFGRLWQFRCGMEIGLAGFLLFCRLTGRHSGWLFFGGVGGLLSGIILGALALGGHGIDDNGAAGVLHLASDIFHLLAAGGWLGALIPLIFVLRQARRPDWLRIAQQTTLRFSTLGMVTVATLIMTGLVNSWYLVGNVPALIGTPYGRLLLVKLALFAAMLSLAAVNRIRLTPRLLASRSARTVVPQPLRRLWRNAACETGFGLLVLLAVGALVHLQPGLHDQPVWPFPITVNLAGIVLTRGTGLVLVAMAATAALGLVATALTLWRRRWLLAAVSVAAVVLASGLGLHPFVVEAFPTSYMHSPIRYSAQSIARGIPLYAENCVLCHGPNGFGDGPAAASLPIKPANLTEHLFYHGEGTLFWWLSHGKAGTPMPGFDVQLSETQRWDMLNFLRAQADADGAKFMAADVEPRMPVVAPDFAFQISHGPQETLVQQRNRFVVLLVLFHGSESLPRLRELDAATAQLERVGVRVIALPISTDEKVPDEPDPTLSHLLIAETNPATIAAYNLFRRTSSVTGVLATPPHMEFLIDRQGYLRYRWSPAYGTRWSRIPELLRRIDSLNQEPAAPPTPGGHAH